jgi:hypothetical protein
MTKKYQRKPNGFAEDLGAAIGLTNTLLLCGTRGRTQLYVPEKASPGHLLETLLGPTAFAAMVAEWGGETITIPALADFARYQRIRSCAQLLAAGKSLHSIALMTGVTYNQAKNDRRSAELLGILPLVLRGETKLATDEQVVGQLGFEGF